MSKNKIYLCLAKMSPTGTEQRYINEAFVSNWIAPLGPNVDAFEEALKCHFERSEAESRNLLVQLHPGKKDFSTTPGGSGRNDVYVAALSAGICLPSGPWVTDEDVKYIVETLLQQIS